MAVQAQTAQATGTGVSRRDLLITLLILLLGASIMVLGGFSAQPGDRSTFTDRALGTLFSLPSQGTLYTVGVLCFFVAGMRFYRNLGTLRSVLIWVMAFMVALAFLVWITSGTSLNLSGMIQSPL